MLHKGIALAACLLAATATAQDNTGAVNAQPGTQATKPAGSYVLPPDAKVEGTSFGQLTAKWWQRANAMPIAPYLDPDGRLCTFNQDGPVWFLAGTDGTYTAHRECVIPTGKYVLLPIINMIYNNPDRATKNWKKSSCVELQAAAAVNNDRLSSAVVLIDGVQVPDIVRYRVRSDGCFALSENPDEDGNPAPQSAADGYWLLLKPLSPGRHTISVGANYGADQDGYGRMVQNFEYVLDVGGRSDLALQRDAQVRSNIAVASVGAASAATNGNRGLAYFQTVRDRQRVTAFLILLWMPFMLRCLRLSGG